MVLPGVIPDEGKQVMSNSDIDWNRKMYFQMINPYGPRIHQLIPSPLTPFAHSDNAIDADIQNQ